MCAGSVDQTYLVDGEAVGETMNRLIPRTIVEIPEHDPVIAYKKLMKDMRSPYRHHTYEIGKDIS